MLSSHSTNPIYVHMRRTASSSSSLSSLSSLWTTSKMKKRTTTTTTKSASLLNVMNRQTKKSIIPSMMINKNIITSSTPISSFSSSSSVYFIPKLYSTSSILSFSSSSSKSKPMSTMEQIKELRLRTGAPMMECKKALNETNTNIEKAIDWLRKNGSSKASSKVLGRLSSEGLVGLLIDGDDDDRAVLIKVSSETDFASRSNMFTKFVEQIAYTSLSLANTNTTTTTTTTSGSDDDGGGLHNIDIESTLMNTKIVLPKDENDNTNNNLTVKDVLDETILAIRENLQIVHATILTPSTSTSSSILVGYVHGKMSNSIIAGTSAAVVELIPTKTKTETNDKNVIQDIGKKLAMHIVAAKTMYLHRSDVPKDIIDKEYSILKEQMVDSNKSIEIQEKIIMGRMNKFYESSCLLEQEHMIEEGNPKIEKYLKSFGIEIQSFQYISI